MPCKTSFCSTLCRIQIFHSRFRFLFLQIRINMISILSDACSNLVQILQKKRRIGEIQSGYETKVYTMCQYCNQKEAMEKEYSSCWEATTKETGVQTDDVLGKTPTNLAALYEHKMNQLLNDRSIEVL
jgi:hypothetical protein